MKLPSENQFSLTRVRNWFSRALIYLTLWRGILETWLRCPGRSPFVKARIQKGNPISSKLGLLIEADPHAASLRKTLALCPQNLPKVVMALLVFEVGVTALFGQLLKPTLSRASTYPSPMAIGMECMTFTILSRTSPISCR